MRRGWLAITTLLLAACSAAAPSPAPSSPASLDGRAFLSVSVNDAGRPRELVAETRIRIAFSDGKIGARAGCNAMGGSYRLDSGRVIVESLANTDMGCDQPRMEQDAWLARFLLAGPALTLAGNDLTLAGDGTVIMLLDRRIADPDRPLVGTVWRVESLMVGQGVQSLPTEVPAWLVFGSNGRVAIETGCNTGEAAFTLESGAIRFSEIGLTKKACAGPAGEQEAAIVGVLRTARLTYAIEAASLILTGGDRGLGLRAG